MELEKLKRANEIQQTTAYLKEHLNLRSISEDATKIYFDSRGTALIPHYLPMDAAEFQKQYVRNIEAKIARLEDEFSRL